MDLGTASVAKMKKRNPVQRLSKNKTLKPSPRTFPPESSKKTEEAAEVDCMDNLFNLDSFNPREKSYLEKTFVNLIKCNKLSADMITVHIKAIVEQLQLEVNLDINTMDVHLKDIGMLHDELISKGDMLQNELQTVKNDSGLYERYITDQEYYKFKNDTWNSLINLGREELQKRQFKLEKMREDLNNQLQALQQRLRICNLLLWTLNNEEKKRKQRLHMLSLYSHKDINLTQIIGQETECLNNAKSAFEKMLTEGFSDMSHTKNNCPSILNEQRLGCSFDFVLYHGVNRGGSVKDYNDIVKIFEKQCPVFESLVNSDKTKKLLENVFERQTYRLQRENEVYLLNVCPTDSALQSCSITLVSQEKNRPMTTVFSNHPTSKTQEKERISFQNSGQNGLKTNKEVERNEEPKCESISSANKQDKMILATSEQNESTSPKKFKPLRILKKSHNRYGLRSESVLENDSKSEAELDFDLETEEILCDMKQVSISDGDQSVDTRTTHAKNNDTFPRNKNSVQKIKIEVRKLSEKNEPCKLDTNSSYKNKTELMRKLAVRMDSLEKLVQEANLELSNIKEGTMAFQESMEQFKNMLMKNKDCEVASEAKALESKVQGNEKKRSELLRNLRVMYTFLKRSVTCRSSIEERELFLLNLETSLRIRQIEELVLRAAINIRELPVAELRQMQTKDLKLKDISKILTLVQDLLQCKEEDNLSYSSDSSTT